MMDVENQDTVKCTSNRVVEKDFSDNVEHRKSPQAFRSRAFRTLSDVLDFPSGGGGGMNWSILGYVRGTRRIHKTEAWQAFQTALRAQKNF